MNQKELKIFNNLNKRKSIHVISNQEELQNFIHQTLKNKNTINKQINIGQLTDEAKQRINNLYGRSVSFIDLDTSGIIHAYKKENHNLEYDDLLHIMNIINRTEKIKISDKRHENNDVIEFDDIINGSIKILAEIHIKKDYLKVFNAWRKNKATRRRDATENSPAQLTSETLLVPAPIDNLTYNYIEVKKSENES